MLELSRLACLGGLAAGLLGDACRPEDWPAAITAWLDQVQPPPELTDLVRAALGRDHDPLAAIYERTVTPRHRRQLGTFFTPDVLVEHMIDTAARMMPSDPSIIIDPGAGVGAFATAARRRWPNATVHAVDVNVVTLGLLGVRLVHEGLADRTVLAHEDFLGWLDRQEPETPGPWLFLGNPPYTRTQALDGQTKRRASELAGDAISSGHATLSTLFAAAIMARLRPQDAACLLLPAAWTHTRSARELRAALWQASSRPLELHRWPFRTRAFTGPGVTATVLAIGAATASSQPYRYGRAEVSDSRVDLSATEMRSRDAPCPDPWPGGAGRRVASVPVRTLPLAEFFRVRRGTATGANDFFFVDEAVAATLPDEVQRPGLITLRGTDLDGADLDRAAWEHLVRRGVRCVLLDIHHGDALDPRMARYIEAGEAAGYHERYLCSKRSPWFAIEPIQTPDFLFAPLLKDKVHLVRNLVGALPSNSLYGLYPHPMVDSDAIGRVSTWLRSDDGLNALRGHARRLPGGSFKLEPGELRTLPVPSELLAGRSSGTLLTLPQLVP